MTEFTPISDLQRVVDTLAVQNLMGQRAYYHVAGRNEKEFELYSKRPDICWRQNQGVMVGHDAIRAYYVDGNFSQQDESLRALQERYPEVEVKPDNRGMGSFVMHTLSTPVIVIADDGETAKGMWYTPGVALVTTPTGVDSIWIWERYAVDFIKEDGQWRFWHIFVMTDFMLPTGEKLTAKGAEGDVNVGNEGSFGPAVPPDWSIDEQQYEDWYPARSTHYNLEAPQPYRTFSETTSYAPPGV